MKTSELIGPALDWAVAKCLGRQWPDPAAKFLGEQHFKPSTDWAQGGPIIEREEIGTNRRAPSMKGEEWEARGSITAKGAGYWFATGPTPLIAAMRCFCCARLGDEIDIPEELCPQQST